MINYKLRQDKTFLEKKRKKSFGKGLGNFWKCFIRFLRVLQTKVAKHYGVRKIYRSKPKIHKENYYDNKQKSS